MKLIRTEDAVGQVLCHDITQIIPGVTKDAVFRKGHIVQPEDIPVLLSVGKDHLYVWENDETKLHENEAAEILRDLCQGPHMHATEPKEGKIELIADCDGLFLADIDRLRAVNSLGEMMIATRPSGFVVKKGDKLVQMQTNTLEAEKAATLANIKVQEGELAMARATVKQKESTFSGAEKEFKRQSKLISSNAVSQRVFDEAETLYNNAKADLEYARANVIAAEGRVAEQKAELQRIEADLADSTLVATYDGRIQYLLAHEGEVLSAGGRVMNLVNLTDTYMTFFLPTSIAGRVQMGAEVKLNIDYLENKKELDKLADRVYEKLEEDIIFGRYAIRRGYGSWTITFYTYLFCAAGDDRFRRLSAVERWGDLPRSSVHALWEARSGRVYIGTWGAGLYCYDPSEGVIRFFDRITAASSAEDADTSRRIVPRRAKRHRNAVQSP